VKEDMRARAEGSGFGPIAVMVGMRSPEEAPLHAIQPPIHFVALIGNEMAFARVYF